MEKSFFIFSWSTLEVRIFKVRCSVLLRKISWLVPKCSNLTIFGFGPSLPIIWNFWNSGGWRVKRHVGTLLQSLIYATHSLYELLGFNPTPFCVHFGGPKNLKRFKSPLFISQNLVWGLYEGPWRRIFEWNTAHKTIIHRSKKFRRKKLFLSNYSRALVLHTSMHHNFPRS